MARGTVKTITSHLTELRTQYFEEGKKVWWTVGKV